MLTEKLPPTLESESKYASNSSSYVSDKKKNGSEHGVSVKGGIATDIRK